MCFRFQQFDPEWSDSDYEEALKILLGRPVPLPPNFVQQGNIAITDRALVVPNREPREGRMFSFGLMPNWATKEFNIQQTANARGESVHEKPSFRDAFASKRALIPVTGFYDWTGPKNKKVPYKAFLKSVEMFCLAGLWDGWKAPTGDIVYTFSIITSEPNELWAKIHDRMPVIMPKEYYDLWLAEGEVDPEALKATLKPYSAKEMAYVEFDKAVSSTKNKDNSTLKPVGKMITVESADSPEPSQASLF